MRNKQRVKKLETTVKKEKIKIPCFREIYGIGKCICTLKKQQGVIPTLEEVYRK